MFFSLCEVRVMFKTWLGLVFLIALTRETEAQNKSLEDLIAGIFSTEPTIPKYTSPPQPTPDSREEPNYKSCGEGKVCVPRFLCNKTLNTNGENIIDIRIDSTNECSYLEICCDLPNKVKQTPNNPYQHTEVPQGCGHRNPYGVGFKITGARNMETEFGEFPWVIAILRQEASSKDNLFLYECGGSLIAPNVVLTAAHCVHNKDPSMLIARAGEWDSQTTNEIIPHQDRRVESIIYHEDFVKGTLYNDIALLILVSPFTLDSNVLPICLPDPSMKFEGALCYATGWGKDKFGRDGIYQVILKKIDLPIVSHEKCQRQLQNTRLGKYFELHDSFICAGGEEDKDTCKGDGGSPLMCSIPQDPTRFYQAGIVAWGIGCGVKDVPGVYANVPYLKDWISRQMVKRNIDSSYSLYKN